MKSISLVLVAFALVFAAACGKKPAPAAPAPSTPTQEVVRAAVVAQASAPDPAIAARAEDARRRAALEARVLFDYDEDRIRDDSKRILDDKVAILRALPEVRIRIEGNADERGSTEYNLALGARRATTVASYLTGYGVRPSQIETISLGEERPVDAGHDERSWSQNRRADFIVVSGL